VVRNLQNDTEPPGTTGGSASFRAGNSVRQHNHRLNHRSAPVQPAMRVTHVDGVPIPAVWPEVRPNSKIRTSAAIEVARSLIRPRSEPFGRSAVCISTRKNPDKSGSATFPDRQEQAQPPSAQSLTFERARPETSPARSRVRQKTDPPRTRRFMGIAERNLVRPPTKESS